MPFHPVEDNDFVKGQLLLAEQLNNLLDRLRRLEKVSSGNLQTLNSPIGIGFNLMQNVPDVEFIETTIEVTSSDSTLFTGEILDQNADGFFKTGEEIQFRNIFGCTLASGKKALVIRFPRGNGEYLWIPKACN